MSQITVLSLRDSATVLKVSLPQTGPCLQRCIKRGWWVSCRCLHSHRHDWLLHITHCGSCLHRCCSWSHWSSGHSHHAGLCAVCHTWHSHHPRLPSCHHGWLLVADHASWLTIDCRQTIADWHSIICNKTNLFH